jgi:hypothetical protein
LMCHSFSHCVFDWTIDSLLDKKKLPHQTFQEPT